jgi:3-oxoacyl-[acyl-carrier-protein] synthase-1
LSGKTAEIVAVGMITSVGGDAPRTAAAVRAGVSRVRSTWLHDRRGEPFFMAAVPDEDLPTSNDDQPVSEREDRMTRLARAALREATADVPESDRIPLLLSLPEAVPGRAAPVGPDFLHRLTANGDVRFDVAASRVAPGGRAAGLALLAEAMQRIASRAAPLVLVGGVDSPFDAGWISALDDEDRIRAAGVRDGFTPGEAAACLLIGPPGAARKARRAPIARIDGVAAAYETGHRYSPEPYRGDGLDAAFRALFTEIGGNVGPIRSVYAGLNGESFHAKEWGVARLRHQARFAENCSLFHPADRLGDTGAAMGPLTLGLAAIGLEKGYRSSPSLVWCSSDMGGRAAAVVSAAGA